MTPRVQVQCLVIVTESVLETRLLRALETCGARGWTITTARGHGPRDRRVSDLEGGQLRIETLVSEDVAERIWSVLADDFFAEYAVTAWSYPAMVQRPARYGS